MSRCSAWPASLRRVTDVVRQTWRRGLDAFLERLEELASAGRG